MLALSSLSNNSRFVGIIYAGLIFFSDALFGVLRAVTGESAPVVGGVRQQSRANRRRDVSRAAALFDALARVADDDRRAPVAVSAVILERRVRGVEVIA